MDTKKLRQKVLDLAIRGKLVSQDPNDEPAYVLLERIRNEKERLIEEGKIKRDKKESKFEKSHYRKSITNNELQITNEEVPFEIPYNWEWAKLGDIFEINPTNNLDDKIDVSFIPMKLISDGFANKHTAEIKKWLDIKKGFTHFQEGDVGLAKITPCFENRKSVVFQNLKSGFGAGTTELHVLRPISEPFLSNYLIWFVKTEDFITNGVNCFTGAVGQQRIGKIVIEKTYFPLPPLEEQHRIVQKIEDCFALIEQIEQNKLSLSQVLKQIKYKVLDLAIHGKLVPQDPNDEPASVLLEKIKKEQKNPKSSADILHYPFEVPEGWVWCKLNEIGVTNIGLTYKPSEVCNNGVPVLRSNNIKGEKLDLSDLVKVSSKLTDNLNITSGDILICARNGSRTLVGKCALISDTDEILTFGAFMAVYRSSFNQYIFRFLNSSYFRSRLDESNSTQINQLTQDMLKNTFIPLPPIAEQHRIVSKIEQFFAQIDEIENSIKA